MLKTTQKKRILIFLVFILAAVCLAGVLSRPSSGKTVGPSAVDYQRLDLESPKEDISFVSSVNSAARNAAVQDELHLANVVIFIYFKNESAPTINQSVISKFTGEENSLYDYYYDISYGKILITTYYASGGEGINTVYYAYQAPQNRSYYENIKSGNSSRSRVERELLVGAINHFDERMNYEGVNLDQNSDGYVDNISFIVSGNYVNSSANWGGLMWPHSLTMTALNNSTKNPNVTIQGKIVDYYTFNFLGRLTTGLLCHEFSHILGTPDLYHYDYDRDYLPVGYWDLMHFECDTPQYMTTWMRYKYLGSNSLALSSLIAGKISQITSSGEFALKPTTTIGVESGDILAYKIEVNEDESIWIEYRNKNSGDYDSELPGSGLVVYRVNTKATNGNQNAKNRNAAYPEELYVFRPNFSTISDRNSREQENLRYAHLSASNAKFSTLGKSNTTSYYDSQCVYLSDGTNTGIIITPKTQSDGEITFDVTIPPSLASANQVDKVEVLDKVKYDTHGIKDSNITIGYSNNLLTTLANSVKVIITYKDGSSTIATMSNVSFVFDTGKIGFSQQATARYSDAYNTNIVGYFNLTIRDGAFTASVLNYPTRQTYNLGSELDLTGLTLLITYSSGTASQVRYVDAPQRFTWVGFDGTTGGQYRVEVTYTDELGNRDTVILSLTVVANIVSIEINTRNSEQLISFPQGTGYETIKSALVEHIEVVGTQEDGLTTVLPSAAYEIKDFTYDGLGSSYNIVVLLLPDKTIESEPFRINLVDATHVRGVTLSILPKLDYRYGESLNLSAGMLTIVTDNGSFNILLEGYYNKYDELYDCTRSGRQSLTVRIYGYDITITVIVGNETEQLMTVNADNIYMKTGAKNSLRVDGSMTIGALVAKLASVFTVKLFYNNMYINLNAYKDMLVSDKVSVHLFNDNNKPVAAFGVSVLGDTNSDGVLDENDIDALALALVKSKYKNDSFDVNLDGVYDIVDLVLLLERIR